MQSINKFAAGQKRPILTNIIQILLPLHWQWDLTTDQRTDQSGGASDEVGKLFLGNDPSKLSPIIYATSTTKLKKTKLVIFVEIKLRAAYKVVQNGPMGSLQMFLLYSSILFLPVSFLSNVQCVFQIIKSDISFTSSNWSPKLSFYDG